MVTKRKSKKQLYPPRNWDDAIKIARIIQKNILENGSAREKNIRVVDRNTLRPYGINFTGVDSTDRNSGSEIVYYTIDELKGLHLMYIPAIQKSKPISVSLQLEPHFYSEGLMDYHLVIKFSRNMSKEQLKYFLDKTGFIIDCSVIDEKITEIQKDAEEYCKKLEREKEFWTLDKY